MTLAIVLLVAPPALWAADRLFNRGELFTLLREEFGMVSEPRLRAAKRVRMTVRR